jgi:poly(glycerol-phosphate) alpha-glucosyltransferase
MIYFLNIDIGREATGIEHSAIGRWKLFKANNIESKIVTNQYNCDLHKNIQSFGLQSRDILNMYDFFQNAVEYDETEQSTLETLCRRTQCYCKMVTGTDYRLYDQSDFCHMYVHCAKESGKLVYVNHFDINNKKVRRDYYDVRGFKSRELFLGDEQKIIHEIYYSPDGKAAIHKYYGQYNREKSDVTLIEVNYNNTIKIFYSEGEWITFFLDCIAWTPDGSENILISDRPRIYANPLAKMREKAAKIAVIHSRHKYETKGGYRINSHHQPIVENLKSFSAVVMSSKRQREDFMEDFGSETPIFAIPSGYSQQKKPRQAYQIQKNKIISVARYSEEKRLDHLIRAFDKIKDVFPNSELHLYGGNSGFATEKKLKALADELNLNERVFFRGYLYNLESEYNSADLFVLSSLDEGFGLVLLEASAYGIPIVAYDIKYGPEELVEDGASGYLVKSGDIDGLADKMASVLSDESKKRAFGIRAREIAARFSEAIIWEKWRELLQSIAAESEKMQLFAAESEKTQPSATVFGKLGELFQKMTKSQ